MLQYFTVFYLVRAKYVDLSIVWFQFVNPTVDELVSYTGMYRLLPVALNRFLFLPR